VIKLPLARIAQDTRWEEVPDVSTFPHLYRNFGRRDVEAVKGFRRGEGQVWSEALAGEGAFLE
jgi:hypothetical protein